MCPYLFNFSLQRNIQIELTNCDETKKETTFLQINSLRLVRVSLKLCMPIPSDISTLASWTLSYMSNYIINVAILYEIQ